MIRTSRIRLATQGNGEVADITTLVNREVQQSPVRDGTVTLFVTGSTAALMVMENEPGLRLDLKELFDALVPQDRPYHHNRRGEDDNGHAHLRASLLGPSLVVPLEDGRLTLGTWQQVVLVDFDVRPRSREVVVQICGD